MRDAVDAMPPDPPFTIRPYESADEGGWLRCRVLAFLDTQYFDDVKTSKTTMQGPSVELVAASADGTVVGILDIEVDVEGATIDTVAVHPDHQGRGIASALLAAALPQLRAHGVGTLDAWTREDEPANAWYLREGFVEAFRYLHVHIGDDDDRTGFATPDGLSGPVTAFLHARIEDEAQMRLRYRRVHVCRRYVVDLPPQDQPTA